MVSCIARRLEEIGYDVMEHTFGVLHTKLGIL